jgi:acyl dehydratase
VSGEPSLAPRDWGRAADWARPFDQLAIGDRYISKRRTVTEADIVAFAGLVGEMDAAHGDPTRFGAAGGAGPTAPDLLPLTYSIGLVPNRRIGALRRILDLELAAPARPGDTLHVEAEIIRLEEWTEDYGLVTGRWRILNQREEVIATVNLEAVWTR